MGVLGVLETKNDYPAHSKPTSKQQASMFARAGRWGAPFRRVQTAAAATPRENDFSPVPLATPPIRHPETVRGSIKPCVECRWCDNTCRNMHAPLCHLWGQVHLVTGEVSYQYASVARQYLCKGKDWESKHSPATPASTAATATEDTDAD